MIRRKGEFESEVREKMRGGDGKATIEHLWKAKSELNAPSTRLFAKVVLEPGSGIGTHPHDKEEEIYVILKGEAEVDDNGVKAILKPGDTILTGNGASHSIKCHGSETLEFMAVINTF